MKDREVQFMLCDPDGVVRRGEFFKRAGKEYQCSGIAHTWLPYVKCVNPIHENRDESNEAASN